MSNNLPMVIIGSGGAAVNAVKTIRKEGYPGEIHLFSDSNHPPFNPMLLTYYLGGKIPLSNCYLNGKDLDFYKAFGVDLHYGSPVLDLDIDEQAVTVANGQKLHFESCLIASGASAIIPPIPGSKSQRVFSIRSIEDAVRLREIILNKPKKAILVGASMVGIKLVEIFQEIGSEVVLVDLAPHIFPQAAHPQCAGIMEENLQKRGIRLLMNTRVEGIEESTESLKVTLAGQVSELEADLLVFCVGVKPNRQFIRPGSLAMENGILVDNRMRTSAENIFAAGDVVQGLNLISQKKEVIALWANACLQGLVAGANMAGADKLYPGSIPQNITHFFDVFFVSIGDIHSCDSIEQWHEDTAHAYFFKFRDRLVGINFLTQGGYELINTAGVIRSEILKALHNEAPCYWEGNVMAETILNIHRVIKNGGMVS